MLNNILLSALAGLLGGAAFWAAATAAACATTRRRAEQYRRCRDCKHYPPHGSFPARCSGCRACSLFEA